MGPNERIGRESTDIYTRKGRFPSQFFNKKIEDDGIHYEYWIDSYDYSGGRDHFSVSVEKIESLVDDYKRKLRKKKLLKLKK